MMPCIKKIIIFAAGIFMIVFANQAFSTYESLENTFEGLVRFLENQQVDDISHPIQQEFEDILHTIDLHFIRNPSESSTMCENFLNTLASKVASDSTTRRIVEGYLITKISSLGDDFH